MSSDAIRLTKKEIFKVVYRYIGVSPQGYLGDFSYSSHQKFYIYYCDLEIDPMEYPGSTRERFITILERCEPADQAKILKGVLDKYPVLSSNDRTQDLYDEIKQMIARLEGTPAVVSPLPEITSEKEQPVPKTATNMETKPGKDESEYHAVQIAGIRRQLIDQTRNLHKLLDQAATYGSLLMAPLSLQNEIERIETHIAKLKEKLTELEQGS